MIVEIIEMANIRVSVADTQCVGPRTVIQLFVFNVNLKIEIYSWKSPWKQMCLGSPTIHNLCYLQKFQICIKGFSLKAHPIFQ